MGALLSSWNAIGMLANHFHIDAIRIQHIGRVIVGVVVRSDPGWTVVGSAGLKCSSMKGIDDGSLVSGKGEVSAGPWRFVVVNPEAGIAILAETVACASAAGALRPDGDDPGDVQRCQGLFVKASGRFGVTHRKFDVIKDGHGRMLLEGREERLEGPPGQPGHRRKAGPGQPGACRR